MKWIKKILLLPILLISCNKDYMEPLPQPVSDIFLVSEVLVSDASDLYFNMDKDGSFILKIEDYNTGQILSKEKIDLIDGKNSIKIYTKSLTPGIFYLVLDDLNRNEVKRTKIIIK